MSTMELEQFQDTVNRIHPDFFHIIHLIIDKL